MHQGTRSRSLRRYEDRDGGQFRQEDSGRIGSGSSRLGDARIVLYSKNNQNERCDEIASTKRRHQSPSERYSNIGRERSPLFDKGRESERNWDRNFSRSRDPDYKGRDNKDRSQTYRQLSRADRDRNEDRRSLSSDRNSKLRKRSTNDFGWEDYGQWGPDKPPRNHDKPSRQWDKPTQNWDKPTRYRDKASQSLGKPTHSWHNSTQNWGESIRNLDKPNRANERLSSYRDLPNNMNRNWSRTSNYAMWEENDNFGNRTRPEYFNTKSCDRQRSRTPPSRHGSYSPDRHQDYYTNSSNYRPDHQSLQCYDDDEVSHRDIDKYLTEEESDEFENESDGYGKQFCWSPNSNNSDVYGRQNENHNDKRDWQTSISYSSLKLCANSGSISPENCDCAALHICKYFLLSKCLVPNCRFGHDIYTEHNARILQDYFQDKPSIQHLRFEVGKLENRNETTVPQICKFYNNVGGCKPEKKNNGTKCPCLHICKYYVQKNCKFDRCKRSHHLFFGHSLHILRSYGLLPRNHSPAAQEEILDLLDIITAKYTEKIARGQRFDNTKRMDENTKYLTTETTQSALEDPIISNRDFVHFERKSSISTPRYFSFEDTSSSIDDGSESVDITIVANSGHGKSRKRKHKDEYKRKRKKSKGQVHVNVNSAVMNPTINMSDSNSNAHTNNGQKHAYENKITPCTYPGTNDMGPNANIKQIDAKQDVNLEPDMINETVESKQSANLDTNNNDSSAGIRTSDRGLDANLETNVRGLDANIETNGRGLDATLETNDRGLDANIETNGRGLDATLETNDRGLDANIETNDRLLDADLETNDKGLEANLETNDRGLDANLETNDKGLDAHSETKDRGLDANSETNDRGACAYLGDNGRYTSSSQ